MSFCPPLCRLVTTRATPAQKLLVRLVIHPTIWIFMTMYVRHVGRHIGELRRRNCRAMHTPRGQAVCSLANS